MNCAPKVEIMGASSIGAKTKPLADAMITFNVPIMIIAQFGSDGACCYA